MRSSIYDALEVSSSAPVNAIQVALRGVVRRFWAVPRDASGDSEEAVRFAALGASILVDPVRRKDYDAALNPGVGAGPWRLPIGGQTGQDGGTGSTNSRVLGEGSVEPSQLLIEAKPPMALPGVDALAEPLPDGTAWASPMVFLGVAAGWILLVYAFTQRFSGVLPPLGIGEALLVATGVSALILAISMWISRAQEPASAAASLSRLAVIKWRREGSIFIGVPPPQHDTAWIFKLRLMELTRSAAGFVTATNVWRRISARVVDYALVAVILYLGINALGQMFVAFDLWFTALRSPLVLPVLAVLVSIPVEASCYRVFRTTPGKWLFSLMPVLGATRPADHVTPSDSQLAWARAAGAAWGGAALGIWPLALLRLPRNVRLANALETDWEARGDSVSMARPLVAPAVATGIMVLLAASAILYAGWRQDLATISPRMLAASESLQSSATDLLGGFGASTPAPAAPASTPPSTVTEPAGPVVAAPLPEPSSPVIAVKPAPVAPSPTPAAPVKAGPGPVAVTPPAPSVAKKSTTENDMNKLTSAANARRVLLDGYVKQSEAARRSGNYAGLQGNCQRWTQEQPGSADAWRCLGLAQYQNGAGRDALPALRQALKLEPKDSQVESAILGILRP